MVTTIKRSSLIIYYDNNTFTNKRTTVTTSLLLLRLSFLLILIILLDNNHNNNGIVLVVSGLSLLPSSSSSSKSSIVTPYYSLQEKQKQQQKQQQRHNDCTENNPIIMNRRSSTNTDDNLNNNNNNNNNCMNVEERRSFLLKRCFISPILLFGVGTSTILQPEHAYAAITDETDRFADNWWTTSSPSSTTTPSSSVTTTTTTTTNIDVSDEIKVQISKNDLINKYNGKIGIELADITFRSNIRVYVKSIQSNYCYAANLGIQKDWIIVSINNQSMERTNANGVKQYLAMALKDNDKDTVELTFRDPSIFRSKLQDLSSETGPVTTQVAPGTASNTGDVTAAQGSNEQRITVEQLIPAKICTKGAQVDDLLEISYTGTVLDTGYMFDGSSILIDGKGIPGRGNDISIFFVLGKQPYGQFPPGWDVGLIGMCVGERRRIIIPPVFGYGTIGVPKRNIPPNSTLQYDISLISINGLATPQ